MIYFLHIPKTAGTSMRSLFNHGLQQDEVRYIYLPPDGLDLDTLYGLRKASISRLKLLFGHYPFGVDSRLNHPGIYVTCLRETRSRLISNYRQHKRGGFVGNTPFLDYFNSWSPKDMDNYMVRLLAGIGDCVPFGEVTQSHLRLAKLNLTERFTTFGLYEYLPETIARFRRVLALPGGDIGMENITPREQREDIIPAAEIAAVARHNALDEELYSYAKSQFLAQNQ